LIVVAINLAIALGVYHIVSSAAGRSDAALPA
jgi:hypothetical protein